MMEKLNIDSNRNKDQVREDYNDEGQIDEVPANEDRQSGWSEKHRYLHEVVNELRRDKESPFVPTADIGMVWVLSAPGTALEISTDGAYAGSSSDLANINHGIDIVKQITALRVDKEAQDVTKDDIAAYGPILYYNGEDESTADQHYKQNEHLALLASDPEFPIPTSNLVIDHIDRANTPAQVEGIARYLADCDYHGKIATVSIGAHSARVGRYLDHYKSILPEDVQFLNAAAIQTNNPIGTGLREVKKVGEYTEKGFMSPESVFHPKASQSDIENR